MKILQGANGPIFGIWYEYDTGLIDCIDWLYWLIVLIDCIDCIDWCSIVRKSMVGITRCTYEYLSGINRVKQATFFSNPLLQPLRSHTHNQIECTPVINTTINPIDWYCTALVWCRFVVGWGLGRIGWLFLIDNPTFLALLVNDNCDTE